MNDSLFTLADQFVAYKRQNGRVYQTGAYYLEKYIQSASETNPEITVPDRKSIEDFLGKYEDVIGRGNVWLWCKRCRREIPIRLDSISLDQ